MFLEGESPKTNNLSVSLQTHIENVCSKADRKLHTLARIAHYIDLQKKLFL